MKMMRMGRQPASKKIWSRAAIAVAAAATLSLGACGGDDKPEEGGGGDVEIPETAEAAVNQFAASLAAGNLGDAVAMMPETYQKDLNGLVAEFGNSMDPDLWNSITGLGKDVGFILTEKKDILLQSQIFKGMDESGEIGKGYDQAAKSINDFFNSDTITLDSLKKGDMRGLLNGAASGLVSNLKTVPDAAEGFNKFAQMKAETISEDGDTVKLRLTTEGETPKELDFKKVEGCWVPTEMAEGWSEMIGEAKQGLAQLKSPEFAQQKMQMTMGIGMISGIVKQLKSAESSEEIDKMLGGMMQMMGGGGGPDGPPPGF